MNSSSSMVGLIRTGSACRTDEDPSFVREWLRENYHLDSHYHPDTQKWLTAKERADILLEFILDDRYSCLWIFRGGEGAADTLPFLQEHADKIKQAKPKLLLGISDATAFLNYFNQSFHWPVAYATGAAKAARGLLDSQSIKHTLALINNQEAPFNLQNLEPLNDHARLSNTLNAKLCGGNLSMLAISVKDIWEIQTAGKIVMIEDLNEEAYQVARYLNYLKRIHLLDHAAGIIFGDFIFEKSENQQAAVKRTLLRFAQSCDFPVLHTTQFGHGVHAIPLPFYRNAELKLGEVGTLQFT